MSETVKVLVRCRPMNTREKDLDCKCCLKMESSRGFCQITNPNDAKAPPKSFTFDGSYFTDSTTENIYNEIAYPLVEGVTEGYNGTIFAYGQTGCGKSFTMQGISDPPTQRGIIPRSFDHLFETVSVADTTKFLIHASYCEIYNEEIRDLLGKDARAKLDLHEHPEKGVYVNGLTKHPVHNVVECNKIMEKGWRNRATGSTLMNAESSRSHSIFTIMLEMMTPDDEGEEHIRAGKLNLVDLAGSERQAKTGATGDRLKEATKINLSLSALGNVISSLVDGKSKHIPYRDSKLTRLLQDSLGGNTKTLMIACLSPADNNYDETLSTLRYANRAKNIKNKPKINEDPKDALLRQYQEEIERLKAMLMGQIPVPEGGFTGVTSGDSSRTSIQTRDAAQDEEARIELEQEKQTLKEEYDRKLEEMEQQYNEEKVSKAKLEQDMTKLRAFYDSKLSNLDGKIENLPTTAEANHLKAKDNNQLRMMAFQNFMEAFKMAGDPKLGVKGSKSKGDEGELEEGETREERKKKKAAAAGAALAGANIVRNSDGTPKRDTEGKVITHTEYVKVEGGEGNGEPVDRPTSVMGGEQLPAGPDSDIDLDSEYDQYSDQDASGSMRLSSVSDMGDEQQQPQQQQQQLQQQQQQLQQQQQGVQQSDMDVAPLGAPQAMIPTATPNQTAVQHPDQDKKISIVNGQMVIRTVQASGDESIQIRPTTAGVPIPIPANEDMVPGSQAPRSSPTHSNMQEKLKFQQNEAMKRLQELEQQMVGGENKGDKNIKEKRLKKKRFAEERKRKLAEAIGNMDDDGIMLEIYDNIGDELKAKNKLLEKEKEKNEGLSREVMDLSSEFEFDKIDYLDTIRKQEQQLKLQQEIIDRIQPCLRKDCNYSNLDRIRMMCKWDEDSQKWIMPQLKIDKTSLPVGTTLPGGMGNRSPRAMNGEYDEFDDRYRELSPINPRGEPKIMRTRDKTGQFFQTKRASQLVSEPLQKMDMSEVKKSYNIKPQTTLPVTNGFGRNSLVNDQPSNGLMAAKVHGQLMNDEDMLRKPARLQALAPTGKKTKKKKKNYDEM